MKRILVLSASAIIAIAAISCTSQPSAQYARPETQSSSPTRQAAIEAATPIRTIPSGPRPTWTYLVPDSPTTLSFVGTAGRYATETGSFGARHFGHEDGRMQFVDYLGTLMVNQARTHAATFGITSDVLSPEVVGQQFNERAAQNIAQALAPREYYTEVFLDATNHEAFQVFVLMQVDKAIVRRVLDNYGNEQAADYARRAAEEIDQVRRQQLERASEFFGGNLSSRLGF